MIPEQESDASKAVGGLMSFIVAALSAAVSIAATMTWDYMAQQQLYLEGGAAFSANWEPLLMTLSGIIIGTIAALVFVLSLWTGQRSPRQVFSFYHATALVMLTPSAYLLVKMLL